MGEIVEATINGFFCEECGQYIDGEEPGHPRVCKDCDPENGYEVDKGWKE